jgi:hypothetical protein
MKGTKKREEVAKLEKAKTTRMKSIPKISLTYTSRMGQTGTKVRQLSDNFCFV